MSRSPSFRRTVCTVALLSFSLSACVTSPMGGGDGTACSTERAKLTQSEDFFAEAIFRGVVGGAAAGALGGALISGLTGGDVLTGALIGAGTGAVLGGAGAYWEAMNEQSRDRAQIAGQVSSDLARERSQIDRATTTFLQLRNCRFREAEKVKADFRAGLIDRATAQTRLDSIRRSFNEDVRIARQLGAKMDERQAQFETATVNLVEERPGLRQRWERTHQQRLAGVSSGAVPAGYEVGQTTGGSNIRSGPGTGYGKVGFAQAGETVYVTESGTPGWYKIRLDDGRDGYIFGNLVQMYGPGSAPPPPADVTPTAVAQDMGADPNDPYAQAAAEMTATSVSKRRFSSGIAQSEQQAAEVFDIDSVTSFLLLPGDPVFRTQVACACDGN